MSDVPAAVKLRREEKSFSLNGNLPALAEFGAVALLITMVKEPQVKRSLDYRSIFK